MNALSRLLARFTFLRCLVLALALPVATHAAGLNDTGITVLAGSLGTPGDADGTGMAARFDMLQGIATDNVGNLYVANSGGSGTIRKITSSGVVTTVLGGLTSGGPPSFIARTVHGLGVDNAAGVLFYTDTTYRVVKREFPLDSGFQTNYDMSAYFPLDVALPGSRPTEMTLDTAGNAYVALGEYIRKLDPAGVKSTLAGMVGVPRSGDLPIAGSADGVGMAAGFNGAYGVSTDSAGNVYVADSNNKTVRKITPDGVVTTLAGLAGQPGTADGVGAAARFNHPRRLAVDRAGNVYVVDTASTDNYPFVQDTGNSTIRKITPDGVVTTVAGQAGASGGTIPGPLPGRLANLRGIVVGTDAALYVNTYDAVLKIVLPIDPSISTDQSITFNGYPSSLNVGGSVGTLSATGGASGNPVIFSSSTPQYCTVSDANGTTVTPVAVGTCTVVANQAGNASYNAAIPVPQDITVIPAPTPAPVCSPTATPPSISAGASTTLAANCTYSPTSYTWSSNPPSSPVPSGSGGPVSPTVTTIYSVTSANRRGASTPKIVPVLVGGAPSGFVATQANYAETDDLSAACKAEFGVDYDLADWVRLKAFYQAGGSLIDLFVRLNWIDYGTSLLLSNNGQRWADSSQHYYATHQDGKLWIYYSTYDNIDSHTIDLRSWSGISMRVMCYRVPSFPGNRNDYSITRTGLGFSVTDQTGGGGVVALTGASQIKFADVTVNLLIGDLSKTIPTDSLKTLIELYVAFFNRVPEADGLSYWIARFKDGMSLDQIADSFYQAAIAYSSLTGYSSSMSNADFVAIIYRNVLGRTGPTAPTETEVHYWADQITSGALSRYGVIASMLNAAHAYAGDPVWGWVPQLLDNKFSVATIFCLEQGLNYNTPEESIAKGMAIAAAVTPTSTDAAVNLIGFTDAGFNLTGP